MAIAGQEVQIAAGRRTSDGHVRVAVFANRMLALTLTGRGDRTPTLLLTPEQARDLQQALTEMIPLIERTTVVPAVDAPNAFWSGSDRRDLQPEH